MLPATLGLLTRIGQSFRARVEALDARARRAFWTRFYFERGPRALESGEHAARDALERLLTEGDEPRPGFVHLVGTGPGDPELLTLKARRLLHEADVVIHDRLVPPAVLELARREATIVETGKTAYGPSWKQDEINALMLRHARGRRDGGAAEGWRPDGLRAARRRDRGARGCGRRLLGGSRRDRGQRVGGGDRPVADPARAQLVVPGADRARRRRLRRARVARAGAAGRDGGDLHGRQGGDVPARPAADARRRRLDPGDRGREREPPAAAGDRDDADGPAEGAGRGRARGAGHHSLRARAAGGGRWPSSKVREAL